MQYEDIKEGLRVTYAKEPTITDYYVSKDARGQSGKITGTPMSIGSGYQGTFVVPVYNLTTAYIRTFRLKT